MPVNTVKAVDDEVPLQEMTVNSELTTDMSEYFEYTGNGTLQYELEMASAGDAAAAVIDENGLLTLTSGNHAGHESLIVTAWDPSYEEKLAEWLETDGAARKADADVGIRAQKMVSVTVLNRELQYNSSTVKVNSEDLGEAEFSMLPKNVTIAPFVLDAAGVSGPAELTLNYADYFTDPDDPSLEQVTFTCTEEGEQEDTGIQITEQDDRHLTLSAEDAGSRTFVITASDANDPGLVKSVTVKVTTINAMQQIINKFWLPAVILVVVLFGLAVGVTVFIFKRN